MEYIRFALYAAVLTPVLHIVVVVLGGQDPIQSPISALSTGRGADLHALVLAVFGASLFALAMGFRRIARGRLWPWARIVLVLSGLAVWYVAGYYKTTDPALLADPTANDPLWVVACLAGIAMGMLQPGLSRRHRPLGLFSAMCLGVWLLLVPLFLLVNDSWIGAYQRLVGIVFVTWVTGISYTILSRNLQPYPKPAPPPDGWD